MPSAAHFRAVLPDAEALDGATLSAPDMDLDSGWGHNSFEEMCKSLEEAFTRPELGIICTCCAASDPCQTCCHAVGFHVCPAMGKTRYRKGSLYDRCLDGQRVLFNMHRKGLPTQIIEEKQRAYVESGLLTEKEALAIMNAIREHRSEENPLNEPASAGSADEDREDAGGCSSAHCKSVNLKDALRDHEEKLQAGGPEGECTDQWRIYSEIVGCLAGGAVARMLVQASAGAGKSFLLETIGLWCAVNGILFKACAPTGIAAANVEVPGTVVTASTIHYLFDLDTDFKTKLDFSKSGNAKVKDMTTMRVLLIDEVSMMDDVCWDTIKSILEAVRQHCKPVHVLLFGDFKQLPPATSRAPFIVDPLLRHDYKFRVLRQNRRIVKDASRQEELDDYHAVLDDMGHGLDTPRARKFVVDAFVRGATSHQQTAALVDFEGSTSLFAKRRYRDAWNRCVVGRIAGHSNHVLNVKGKVTSRNATSNEFYTDRNARAIRRLARTQALWNLRVAGDFHENWEDKLLAQKPHLMRAMLLANISMPTRFVNGAQGRLLMWHPAQVTRNRPVPATHRELFIRFAKEASSGKAELVNEVDFIDVEAKFEMIAGMWRSQPGLVQVPLVPSYALSIHKSQSLTIRHIVKGCLEGIFAHGHAYTMISRSTDPMNFEFVGLPPADLLDEVAAAWAACGFDVDACFRKACAVTGEWRYTANSGDPTKNVRARLAAKKIAGRPLKVILRTLAEILRPQEQAAQVYEDLLAWIEAADIASQNGCASPLFERRGGGSIFPLGENGEPAKWWLTDLQLAVGAEALRRQSPCIEEAVEPPGDETEPPDAAPPAEDTEEEWTEDERRDAQSEASLGADAAENAELDNCGVVLPLLESSSEAYADDTEDLRPMWARQ
jgi:hypothetical protein